MREKGKMAKGAREPDRARNMGYTLMIEFCIAGAFYTTSSKQWPWTAFEAVVYQNDLQCLGTWSPAFHEKAALFTYPLS
jgi:hypothetical protein